MLMYPTIDQYDPHLDQAAADTIQQQMTLKSLAQLDMLREKLFFEAMEPTASTKEILAYCEHLVKSTSLENISKRSTENNSPPLVNFGFVFHTPSGSTQVTGNVGIHQIEGAAEKVLNPPAQPVIEGEWGSLIA